LLVALMAFRSDSPTRQSAQWRPEDRVLVSDFSVIQALAASPFTLFAATPRALLLYDRAARVWRLPVTTLEGYPRALVRVALADRTDDAVWLGTAAGWARYDAHIRQWQEGPVAGGVLDLAVDEQDPAGGVYLRGASGWMFLPRGGLVPFANRAPLRRVERPLDPRAALADAPAADALRALLLTDPRLRTYQFTAAARTPDQGELFFGTNGLGVLRFSSFGTEFDLLAYGLPARGARALALGDREGQGGVWVGLAPRVGEREGLTWLASDLATTRWIGGRGARGLGFRTARRLLARRGDLWVATERGVSRVNPTSEESQEFSVPEPLALAAATAGVWVGAARGLFLVTDAGEVRAFDTGGQAVLSLAVVSDTLWVGTAVGLAWLAGGALAVTVPDDVARTPALAAPIVAVAAAGDLLVAATPDQLAWRGAAGSWTVLRPAADVGRLTALAADRDGVWVGGEHGVAFWRAAAGRFQTLRVPLDLPAGVHDLVAAPPYLWIATDSGAVRFNREAVVGR
jgi:ligand-binding sensor domain-containing protein